MKEESWITGTFWVVGIHHETREYIPCLTWKHACSPVIHYTSKTECQMECDRLNNGKVINADHLETLTAERHNTEKG
jgi:hypothetical protein